jgi:hypothetical protein
MFTLCSQVLYILLERHVKVRGCCMEGFPNGISACNQLSTIASSYSNNDFVFSNAWIYPVL